MTRKRYFRSITRNRLLEILQQLPDDVELATNQVGNLAVTSPQLLVIGQIDFHTEEYESFGEPDQRQEAKRR